MDTIIELANGFVVMAFGWWTLWHMRETGWKGAWRWTAIGGGVLILLGYGAIVIALPGHAAYGTAALFLVGAVFNWLIAVRESGTTWRFARTVGATLMGLACLTLALPMQGSLWVFAALFVTGSLVQLPAIMDMFRTRHQDNMNALE